MKQKFRTAKVGESLEFFRSLKSFFYPYVENDRVVFTQ
jgi:hypothetical protein